MIIVNISRLNILNNLKFYLVKIKRINNKKAASAAFLLRST